MYVGVIALKQYLKKIYGGSQEEYYSVLKKDLICGTRKFIITVNPEILIMSEKDNQISTMLLDQNASLIPDGIAVVKACKTLNIPITEKIAGVEIAEFLLKEADNQNKSLYLFGASNEVIELLVKKIAVCYPNAKLLGYSNGYVQDKEKVFDEIASLSPDICMVALGVPTQEKLIYKHLDRFEKGVFIGVGGSFDVISGAKSRAPQFFLKHNLEWLYRIMKEPKRLKRFYDNNIKFLFKIKNKD
ncbi:MAG: WecB/TagA/CpsF family glycosyltransferase [Clostridia bacterium]|nr:WecB/TagA/CpsF family glycosyltransferase [Clostridia bacterium]